MAENGNYLITFSARAPYQILKSLSSGLSDDTKSGRRIGGKTDMHDIRKFVQGSLM
jgi:hypothetical protein